MTQPGNRREAIFFEEITETVENGTAHAVTNKATGGAATEYINPANGKFVVVDNSTKQVLQVSGPGFSPNHLVNPNPR